MMNSLFESFDPFMSLLALNFLSLWIILIIPIFFNIYELSSRTFMTLQLLNNFMFLELSASLTNSNKKMNNLFLMSIFLIILTCNITGLIPYIYTMTSQMLFTFTMVLPIWLAFLTFSMIFNTTNFLKHMVPLSTPMLLSQFMTLIETTSQMIRPITLSVRLCANMTAGHILMALASKSIFIFHFSSIILMPLMILETAVAFIQSYVFVMLLSMYLSETY